MTTLFCPSSSLLSSTPSMAPDCRDILAKNENRVSGSGTFLRRINHAEEALNEAKFWAEELQRAEYRGLGDTREAARYRVSQRTGIAESYLKRLRYKWREMGEVAGSQYRALMLAYEDLVQRNEAAAREYREERQELRKERHAADVECARPSVGTDAARD